MFSYVHVFLTYQKFISYVNRFSDVIDNNNFKTDFIIVMLLEETQTKNIIIFLKQLRMHWKLWKASVKVMFISFWLLQCHSFVPCLYLRMRHHLYLISVNLNGLLWLLLYLYYFCLCTDGPYLEILYVFMQLLR